MKLRVFTGLLVIALLLWNTLLVAAAQGDGTVEISQVLSGIEADSLHPSSYLIDQNPDTYWRLKPDATQGWAELNLTQKTLIYGLNINGNLASETELSLEYRTNGQWVPFLAGTLKTIPGTGLIDLSYDQIVTDGLRLCLTGNGAGQSRLNEVKVLGRKADEILHRIQPLKVISSSTSAPFLTDKNTYTQWSASRKGEAILELSQVTLKKIKIFYTQDAKGDLKFEIPDGNGWRQIGSMKRQDPGWSQIDFNGQNITTSKVRITASGSGISGIGETEFWGYGAYEGARRVMIGAQSPETFSQPVNRTFEIEEPEDCCLELAFQEEMTDPVTVNLNGAEIQLQPAFKLRGFTVYKRPLAAKELWKGTNYLRIYPLAAPKTLTNAAIVKQRSDGECPLGAGKLSDGLVLTEASSNPSPVFTLNQKVFIEEVQVFTATDLPGLRLFAWSEGKWLELQGTTNINGQVSFSGSALTDQLKLENPTAGIINELRLLGSMVTNQAPTVKILWPEDGDVVEVPGIGSKELVGFVDNPEARVRVNGQAVDLDGHFFSYKLIKLGMKLWESGTITVTAKDPEGREGSAAIDVVLGEPPLVTLDQANEVIYESKDSTIISGSTRLLHSEVTVNGVTVSVANRRFSTSLKLQEGLNLVTVKCVFELGNGRRKFTKTLYRKVVRYSNPIKLTIDTPLPNTCLKAENVLVSGTTTGLGTVNVMVNGIKAAVNGMSYTATVPLREGLNTILAVAVDSKGNRVEKQITVNRDTTPPVITIIAPVEGTLIANATVGVTANISDPSAIWVTVNGKAINEKQGNYQAAVTFDSDGGRQIVVKAQDAAGNVAMKTIKITIDTKPPLDFQVTADPGGWTNNKQPGISFGTIDETSGVIRYELAIDGGVWRTVASPYQLPEQADGEHVVIVKAVDKAGWERVAGTKIYIDTTPPGAPEYLTVIPGNGLIRVRWSTPSEDVTEYRVERIPVSDPAVHAVTTAEFEDPGLENGTTYQYRVVAVDHAGNVGPATQWKEGTAGLTVEEYHPEHGAVVEYDKLTIVVNPESLPETISSFQVTEVQSAELANRASFPIVSPIYQFSATLKDGANDINMEHILFEKDFLGMLEYDPSQIPPGFPEQNLGVYYYDPMWGRWFQVDQAGVDEEHHRLVFASNHFSLYSIQPTVIEDLSPQELQDVGFSPLKTTSTHGPVIVSPQGGSAMVEVTELVLPGRNGFDFVLKRTYDSSTARGDCPGIAANAQIGISVGDVSDIEEYAQEVLEEGGLSLGADLERRIKEYFQNNGDYAYTMGVGWRLNLPYIRGANSTILLRLPDGSFYSMNRLNLIDDDNPLGVKRELKFENHTGADFTLYVSQERTDISLIDLMLKQLKIPDWRVTEAKLIMKDGTTYNFGARGRVTKITDPTGLNVIEVKYNDLKLDYIRDSMGRVVKFGYTDNFLMPKINKIWIENDHREINYTVSKTLHDGVHPVPLLKKAKDTGGREWNYDYDYNFLFSGGIGFKVNILAFIADAYTYGEFSRATGLRDLTLKGHMQCEWVFSLKEIEGPGVGFTKIDNYPRLLVYDRTKAGDYFLGLIPTSIEVSLDVLKRIFVRKIERYQSRDGAPVLTTTYVYDVDYYRHGQFLNRRTIEDDGRKKTVYDYSATVKKYLRFLDYSDYAAEILNGIGGSYFSQGGFNLNGLFMEDPFAYEVVPYQTGKKVYNSQTGDLLEQESYQHDLATMRITEQTLQRGANYRSLTYSYDYWGNPTYIFDDSKSYNRTNQTKTWMYYYGTGSLPAEGVPWLDSLFTQPVVERKRLNLVLGKVVANYIPTKNGGEQIMYLHNYYKYDNLGQQTESAQWSGSEWLKTYFDYNTTFGSLIKKINPEGHETVYEYDDYGLPEAVIEKDVMDASGATSDITTRTHYEKITGWKLWEKNPRGYVTEYQYDNLGRTKKITAPDDDDSTDWIPDGTAKDFRQNNPVTDIQYDDQELTSLVTDPRNNRTLYDFDNLGRLERLVKYRRENGQYVEASVTTLQYDGWGNITSITDPNGNVHGLEYKHTTWYEYDVMGRNKAVIYPDETLDPSDNPRKRMEFDGVTNRLTTWDERNNKTVEDQDMQGRTIRQVRYNLNQVIETSHYFDGLGNEVFTVDPKGSTTVKTYNLLNLLKKVELPEEEVWENGRAVRVAPYKKYQYNKAGYQVAEILSLPDGKEQTILIVPDELGRVIRTKVPYTDNGVVKTAVTETWYDGNGNKVKVVDANNTSLPSESQKYFVYTYSATDKVLTETDPAGNKTSYTYDAAGNRVSMTDPRGNSGKYSGDFTIVYEYDDLNRLAKGYLPASPWETAKPVVSLIYDARGNLEQRIEPDGGTTTNTYWPRNLLKTVTISGVGDLSYSTTHYYDAAGNEVEVKDAKGNSTFKEYDPFNRVVRIQHSENNEEQFEYDENNNRTAVIDGRYVRTHYEYDRYNRLVRVDDALGGITNYLYDRWGNMTQMVNAMGHVTKYQYDELNRLLFETDSQGYIKQCRYDVMGNRVWSKDPRGTESTYEYYPNNLVKKVSLVNGSLNQSLEYQYDEAGYRKWVKNDGVVTEYNKFNGVYAPDPFGRVRKESKAFDGKSFTVGYDYDVMGRVTKVTYPTGHAVEYQYNNLGQLVKVPGYVNEKPTYDNGGMLIGLKSANGIDTAWEYDKNGRLTELNYSNQGSFLKRYDFTYDGANNITKKNNDTLQYDLLNQLIYANLKGKFETDPNEEEQKVGKVLDDWLGQNPLELSLDQVDVTELDYARGSIGVDLLDTVFVRKVLLTPQNSEHRIISKDFISVFYGNDGVEYHKYKDWDLLVKEKGLLEIVLGKPLLTRYLKVQCHFDERDIDFNPVNMSTFTNVTKDLIKIYYVTATRQEGYSYDKVGNRTSEVVTQRYPVNRNYTYYPNSGRLKSNGIYSFEYDANGNLIKKETLTGEKVTWEYGYDLLNRLIKVSKNGVKVAEYVYDDSGLRVKKLGQNSSVYFVFNTDGQVIYEQENSGYLEYIHVLGKHFARIDENLENEITKKYFYHTDHLGSTVAVTNEQGQQVWSAEYSPFGMQNTVDGTLEHATQFSGKDLDEDTGLYYFNARWYDQEVGRFVCEDPAKDQNNPNLYTYCRNNPITITDPTGKWSQNKDGDWICDNGRDTLWSLAQKIYGDGSQWRLLNYGKGPTKLQINDTLSESKFGAVNTAMGPMTPDDSSIPYVSDTAISAQTPADKLRNNASKIIKYIPGVNIVNDAYGAVTGQDLTGNLLLTEKEKFDSKFTTFINVGTLGAGAYLSSLEKSVAISLGETAALGTENPYAGVKLASEYLKSIGVSRQKRIEILQSFTEGTIKLDIAGESTYRLRFHDYGINANSKGSFLFDTFTPLTNAENLALPLKWNLRTGIAQWQIKPGSSMITGTVGPQFEFGSQYVGGAKQFWTLKENLLEP